MRKITFLLIILGLSNITQAQYNETIRTGRPGQAIDPFTVGFGIFQTQTGFDFGGSSEKNGSITSNYYAPNTFLRLGLTETFEINSALEFRNDAFDFGNKKVATNGLSLATIGTRIHLLDGEKYSPNLGLQVTFKLPILAKAYDPSYVAPKILLIASKGLSDKFSILLNGGIDYNGNTPQPIGVYVVNLGYSISDKWGTFIENYGNYSNTAYENYWDTGLSYLVNNDLQLDIYGGIGKNNERTDHFVSIGFSWRLVGAKNKTINN